MQNKYEELKSSKLAEGVDENEIDDSALFFQANGGKDKRGRSYGCGSEVAFLETSSSRRKTTHGTNAEIQVLDRRLAAVESGLTDLRSLFEKMYDSFTMQAGSSAVRPNCDDENENFCGDDINEGDDS